MNKYIYILKLGCEKFYVGKTINPERRIRDHIKKRGAAWTKIYPFEKIVNIHQEKTIFDEDIITKILMHHYGIKHVRGGSYSNIKLTYPQLLRLQCEFDTALNKCFNCSSKNCKTKGPCPPCYYCKQPGHRLINCPALLSDLSNPHPYI